MAMFLNGTYRRLRAILAEAPWSNYDLLVSLIVFDIGIYLFRNPTIFQSINGVYASMAQIASERTWAIWFMGCGAFGLVSTTWCVAPSFGFRLLARMAVAFCILILAGNNMLYATPPLSTVTYLLLAAWAVWGILRTKSSGR